MSLQTRDALLSKYGTIYRWSFGVSHCLPPEALPGYVRLTQPAVVFAIYIDSTLFVVVTAILQQIFGVNSSYAMCHGAILLCLVCYVTSKVSPPSPPIRDKVTNKSYRL